MARRGKLGAAVCVAVALATLVAPDAFARGSRTPRIRRDEDGAVEAARIDWAEYSGAGATEGARMVLFASDGRTVDNVNLRRSEVVKAAKKQKLTTQVIYRPKEQEALKEYRELCKAWGVKRVPVIVLVSPAGKAMAVLPLNSSTILQALRLLPTRLKELARAQTAAGGATAPGGEGAAPGSEGDPPSEGQPSAF